MNEIKTAKTETDRRKASRKNQTKFVHQTNGRKASPMYRYLNVSVSATIKLILGVSHDKNTIAGQ